MIEKLLPLKIPPGLVMNGTLEERAGLWADGNLVRFDEGGVIRPVGGFVELVTTPASPPAGTPRGAFAWYNENGTMIRVLVGTSASLYVLAPNTSSTITTVTPAAGVVGTGGTFSFDNLGDQAYITKAGNVPSPVWTWNAGPGGLAAPITAFTTVYGNNARGVVVTPESFLAVIVGHRDIVWASQGGHGVWAPSGTNSAGALDVPTEGYLQRGIVVGRQTLLFGYGDLWELEYVGGDLVYGLQFIADSCGLFGVNAVTTYNSTAYWMGQHSFFQYDGFVREVPCDISEYVFGDINLDPTNRDFAFAVNVTPFNEIWWFYASSGATTPDRVAIFNTVDKKWSKGLLARAAGIHAVVDSAGSMPNELKAPVLFHADDTIYIHEIPAGIAGAYIESGPIMLGDGEQVFRVQKCIPDGARSGDDITLFARTFPDVAETSSTFAVTAGAGPVDVRFSARQIRYKQTLETNTSRVGIPKLGIIPTGTR